MITLYRHESDEKAGEIEEKFKELVLAYHVENLPESSEFYILDGNTRVEGDEETEEWLLKLEAELKWQRSLSGDGCYITPGDKRFVKCIILKNF